MAPLRGLASDLGSAPSGCEAEALAGLFPSLPQWVPPPMCYSQWLLVLPVLTGFSEMGTATNTAHSHLPGLFPAPHVPPDPLWFW